jgi:hypothetical protein
LKFNRSFEKGVCGGELAMQIDGDWRDSTPRNCAAPPAFPLLARFVGKFVLDILPAALASVIGGFLFTQYQLGRAAPPPPAEQVSPASAEVLALVRDEHEAIVGYLKSQMTAEKNRLAAQDAETARAVADAKTAQDKTAQDKTAQDKTAQDKTAQDKTAQDKTAQDKAAQDSEAREKALAEENAVDSKLPAAAPARRLASAMAAKVALPRAKPAAAPNPVAATEIATVQSEQNPQQSAAPADRLASDPDSLLAKTLDLKDHVVAVTKQAVAAFGDMFASVGERFGASPPTPRPFSSDS